MKGNIFSRSQRNRPKRNAFNLSHERKSTMRFGDLTPIMCQEVLPGDSFRVNTQSMVRFAPMISPMMHRVDVYTHYFFVPNRLVWKDWENFITGGERGEFLKANQPVIPFIKVPDSHDNQANTLSTILADTAIDGLHPFCEGSLCDHMGYPIIHRDTAAMNSVTMPACSSLPLRAYALIYDEYYRSQDLQDKIDINYDASGLETDEQMQKLLAMRQRNWRKDYFTSCLPYAQKGDPVVVPTAGSDGWSPTIVQTSVTQPFPTPTPTALAVQRSSSDPRLGVVGYMDSASGTSVHKPLDFTYETEDGGFLISDFRRANALQRWLEKNARAGSRYAEFLTEHFGTSNDDLRLFRPRFLGGGKNPVMISEVLQNSETGNSPQGTMAGHGIGVGTQHGFTYNFKEHGYIIGIMSIMPEPAYMQQFPRHLFRQCPFDYYFRDFANIGEQEVYNKELCFDFNANMNDASLEHNDDVFGYQSRYAEYKYNPSTVHGDMRRNMAFWHMARQWQSISAQSMWTPQLNSKFLTCTQDSNIMRPFAVTDYKNNPLWVQLYHSVKAIRPLPVFSNPY